MKREKLFISSDEETFANVEESGETNQELAKDRTRLAMIRTVLSNERSFGAWIRTGISSELGGLAVAKLLPDFQPDWIPIIIGFLFLFVGATSFIYGAWRYQSRMTRLVSTDNKFFTVYGFWAMNFLLFVGVILVGTMLLIK